MKCHGNKINRFPVKLKPGDTVGIAAPAGTFNRERLHQGVEVLEAMGLSVKIPDSVFESAGYFAGTDRQRADGLNRLFADPDIKAVICARGGYGSMRMLPFVDFEIIRNNPKVLMGFSDVTALLIALYYRSGLVTFHGPVVTTLQDVSPETKRMMQQIFFTGKISEIVPQKGVSIRSGVASGPLIGGNLTTLCHLVGTPFEPDLNGHILFLEDVGEAPYRIDRMLTQIRLSGLFEGISGLMLGSFKDCGSEDEIQRLFDNIFQNMNIPILAGFAVGHDKNDGIVPVGVNATLDAEAQRLRFDSLSLLQG